MNRLQEKIIDNIFLVSLVLLFLYAFWYQFAFQPISGAMNILGITVLLMACICVRLDWTFYRYITDIFGFIIYVIVFTLVAENPLESYKIVFDIVQYTIPMIGIYIYVAGHIQRFYNILYAISLAVVLLAASSFLHGNITNIGFISVGSLNKNVFSSYLMIALAANLLLLFCSETYLWQKIYLVLGIIVFFSAQINVASRRGIIVFALLFLGCLYSFIKIKYKKNIIVHITVILILILFFLYFFNSYLGKMSDLLIFQRFMERNNAGDIIRKKLQREAINILSSYPLFGGGLGIVEVHAGMYSHSMYYELLACTGTVGFFLMITILFKRICFFIKCQLKNLLIAPKMQVFNSIFIWLMLSLFIAGYAVVFIYDMYFYVLLGIIFSAQIIIHKENVSKVY